MVEEFGSQGTSEWVKKLLGFPNTADDKRRQEAGERGWLVSWFLGPSQGESQARKGEVGS